MQVLGLDIGGANIKAATDSAESVSIPLEIWRASDRLPEVLASILSRFATVQLLAVTMTAELADCYATKSEGIDRILSGVESVAGDRAIRVWQTSGEFVPTDVARDEPRLTAAANWHAQATFVGRLVPRGSAVLIDIGSTTTDLIPIINGLPLPTGLTDTERLISSELVYSGVRRTPLCALSERVPMQMTDVSLAAELFATTLDVYLLTDDIPEDLLDAATANGRPATKDAAYDRIVRMICADRTEVSLNEAQRIAEFLANEQLRRLTLAADAVASKLPEPCCTALISGSGAFLARRVVANSERLRMANVLSLPELFGPRVADSACAFALAKLAAERELPFLGAARQSWIR